MVDIDGLPEMPIVDLHLDNIVGFGKSGLIARSTDALALHHLQLNADQGIGIRH